MFQSKLSASSFETKLIKKLFPFNSSSENITAYIEK